MNICFRRIAVGGKRHSRPESNVIGKYSFHKAFWHKAVDYVVHGKMIGGSARVAYPAKYGSSGIMTFIVNHDGVVYQKDLGSQIGKIASVMNQFDPDATWQRVDQKNLTVNVQQRKDVISVSVTDVFRLNAKSSWSRDKLVVLVTDGRLTEGSGKMPSVMFEVKSKHIMKG